MASNMASTILNDLTSVIPVLTRLVEGFKSPVPQHTSRPSIATLSSVEGQNIHVFNQNLQGILRDIRTAIVVLDQTTVYMLEQEDSYQQSLEIHSSLLAPINRLPFEILSDIFLYAHHFSATDFHSTLSHKETAFSQLSLADLRRPTSATTAVAQVNYQWNQIAINTPPLWSTLVVSSNIDIARQSPRASLWFKRSRNTPLNWIFVKESVEGPHPSSFSPSPALIRLLLRHTSQVLSLRIYGDFFSFLLNLRTQGAVFPSLKTFIANQCKLPSYRSASPSSRKPLLINAANITSVRIPGPIDVGLLLSNFNSLQSFMGRLTTQQLYKLWRAPSLQRCRLTGLGKELQAAGCSDIPTSHSLAFLWFDLGHPRDRIPLHRFGPLPHLQSLIIGNSAEVDADAIPNFLRHSGGSLQLFSLSTFRPASVDVMYQYFYWTPNLKRFDWDARESWSVEEFCQRLAEEPILPELNELCILNITLLNQFQPPADSPSQSAPLPIPRSNLKFVRIGALPHLEDTAESIVKHWLPGAELGFMGTGLHKFREFLSKHPYPGADDLL